MLSLFQVLSIVFDGSGIGLVSRNSRLLYVTEGTTTQYKTRNFPKVRRSLYTTLKITPENSRQFSV